MREERREKMHDDKVNDVREIIKGRRQKRIGREWEDDEEENKKKEEKKKIGSYSK